MQTHSTMVPQVCPTCGRSFHVKPCRIRLGYGVYCSRPCFEGFRSATRPDRFWAKVQKSEAGCWIWTGGTNSNGYGTFRVSTGVSEYAHRLAWTLIQGPIPDGLDVCHSCDSLYPIRDVTYRRCVRPDHLFLGTQLDNMRDMRAKGRVGNTRVFGETVGTSKLTEDQVLDIRARHAMGGCTFKGLADGYGVSDTTVAAVVKRKWWKHLA